MARARGVVIAIVVIAIIVVVSGGDSDQQSDSGVPPPSDQRQEAASHYGRLTALPQEHQKKVCQKEPTPARRRLSAKHMRQYRHAYNEYMRLEQELGDTEPLRLTPPAIAIAC